MVSHFEVQSMCPTPVVTGPKNTGKTTAAKQLIQSHLPGGAVSRKLGTW